MDQPANLQDKSASPPAGAAPKSSEGPALSDTKRAPIMRQFELIEAVKAYDPTADEALLNRAYVYAMKMHGSQLRASGDPYFAHPIQVAGILTDYRLDTATIVTALLHDVVEDTSATREDIAEMFGEEVAVLVEGVTKLSRLELQAEHTRQAENLRKFILAISRDVRVLLVKLADRLHNMRTLHFVKPEKRERISRETLEVYAPLGRSIGIHSIAAELEELAFEHLNATARVAIQRRLEALKLENGSAIEAVSPEIERVLSEAGLTARVKGREKTPYSIWRKLQRKTVGFSSLSDIYGFRVIVESEDDCYRALGVIHRAWPMVPERFKDFISTPKSNNYRSLHTTVVGPGGLRIEMQIRTEAMDRVPAELARPGYASGAKMLGDIIERDSNDDSAWEMTMRVPMRFNRLVQRRPWLCIPPGKPSATPPANGRQVYLMFFGSARALPSSRCPCGGSPEPLRFPRAGSGTRPI